MSASVLDLPAADYHADPCERPSLSASIARILIDQSPAHARAAHPRLTAEPTVKESAALDLGTVAHALLLQNTDVAVVVDAKDWRTKDAQEQRDRIRELGQVPLLAKDWERAQAMVGGIREQLARLEVNPAPLTGGSSERTIVWEEAGVLCRSRVDWLHDDHGTVDDVKTTSRSANPEQWSRQLFTGGYDVQAAFHTRGVAALAGRRPDFRFVVCETAPPYAVTVMALAPDALALADAKVDYALGVWSKCLESGEWPSYPRQVCWVHPAGWMEAQWLDREAREAA